MRPDRTHSSNRDGRTYQTAWGGFSEIDWPAILPGDSLRLCGKFSETLALGGSIKAWGGAVGDNVIISGACSHSAGTIQGTKGNGVEITRRDYVTVRDLVIQDVGGNGLAAYGRGGTGTPEANRNLLLKNITVKNAKGSGIIISCLNGYPTYAEQTGIVLEDITIVDAARHGIYVSCNQSGTIIRRANVSGSATAGNYWGIDISARFFEYSGIGWIPVSGPVYKISMAKLNPHWNGLPSWETVTGVVYTSKSPFHLVKNAACTSDSTCAKQLNSFQFAQIADVIYINVGKNPKGDKIAFLTSPFGSATVEDSYVTTTSNNNGTTDGVGIGADLGTNRVTFRNNISEKNEGRGFELSGASDAHVLGNIARQNGSWGYVAHKSRDKGVTFSGNKAIQNRKWQYFAVDNPGGKVSFTDNYIEGTTECFHLSRTPSVVMNNNTCIDR